MIISNFSGNLGNHLFSYALTRTIAEHNNYEWGFNRVPEFDYLDGQEQLNIFEIDYGKEHNNKYWDVPENYTAWREYYDTYENHLFYPFKPDTFEMEDNTKLFISCGQDARYYDKNKLRAWFKVKEQYQFTFPFFDANHCVINIRGGEYKGIDSLLLRQSYWDHAVRTMRERIPECNFLVISDDTPYAKSIFPNFRVEHYSIGMDYWIIQNAQNLILSNSSFAIIPAWLNQRAKNIIAPFGWARHNITTGYWASSDIWTFGFEFLNREGDINKYV